MMDGALIFHIYFRYGQTVDQETETLKFDLLLKFFTMAIFLKPWG